MAWYWWTLFGALIGSLIGIPILNQRILLLKLNRAGLDDPARMTDPEMATHMSRLFHAMGYLVDRPEPEASAFDLILRDGLGQQRGVLLRHWRNPVDESVVAGALAAAVELEKGAPMIVTVRYFSWQARRLAQANGAILWTLTDLTKAIGRLQQASEASAVPQSEPEVAAALTDPLAVLTGATGDLTEPVEGAVDWPEPETEEHDHRWTENTRGMPVPRCPRCGRRMIIRRQHGKRYWGCPAYPRCIGTLRT
ncbi:MAG TPA: restriction endonuclease [Symbiobacteriaceae bacterium]|nr:restriction endonuclease [Symbiobacteriaceae bacterium]